MKVGVLGAGGMGSAMARRLADRGQEVTIWDRSADRRARWDDDRVTVADTAAEAARSADAVVTMVTDGEAARSVAEQMLDALPTDGVWIQASSVGAQAADDLRALADHHGRMMLDAPVSGSTPAVREGKLTWLVSGPLEAVRRSRPVLDDLGDRILEVGVAQEASRLKLAVNTWMVAATVAIADALAACDAMGVPREAFLDVLRGGPLGMPYGLSKAEMMGAGDYEPGFPVELALKDLRLSEQAEGHKSFLLQAVEDRLERAIALGHRRDDIAAVGDPAAARPLAG